MYKVGIFGSGLLAKIHLDNWKEIPGVSVAGFFVPSNEAAQEIESTYAVKRYSSEEELINDSDIIDVVSSTPLHFVHCAKAIRKGKHVFVHKPMVNTMSEAEQLVKLVQESDVKLQVGHLERFNPAFVSLSSLKPEPMLIEAHRMATFQPRGAEVNVVLDLMIHDIDMVLSLVNSEVKHISASGVAVMTDTPDIASARIEFNNGCVANLTSGRISRKPLHEMRLFQKDTYIDIDFLHKKAEVFRLEGSGAKQLSSFSMEIPAGNGGEALSVPGEPEENILKHELQEFVNAVRNNTRTLVNEIDGYRAMEAAHQILQKINSKLSTAR